MDKLKSLFDRFFGGETTENENAYLADLLENDKDGELDAYIEKTWQEAESMDVDFEVEVRVKEKIFAQISSECQVKSSRPWFRFFRAAAVAVGLVAAVLLGWHIADLRKPETFEMVAERGQKSSLTLPDGSKVWLNSASKLTYTSDYNSKDRNIILDGEAFFDVARNENLPFIVHANGMAVQALGTKFNVKAYSDETEVTAILVEGSVKASAAGVDLLLLPYFVASYDRSTDEMVSTYVSDREHAVPWIKNEILFSNDSLKDIASVLERMYNVTVVFENEKIADYTYTGLIRNNSLQNILELISGTSPVKYEIDGNIVRFIP